MIYLNSHKLITDEDLPNDNLMINTGALVTHEKIPHGMYYPGHNFTIPNENITMTFSGTFTNSSDKNIYVRVDGDTYENAMIKPNETKSVALTCVHITSIYISINSNTTQNIPYDHDLNFSYSKLKLEKGNKATAWQPARGELIGKSDVTNLQDQINQLKSKLGG